MIKPSVISVIGHQGSGKTTFLTQLISILIERGYRVGTVKHAPDKQELDSPDKDSSRHRVAGAEQRLVVGAVGYALFWEGAEEEPIDKMIERLFPGYDIVLVEGFKRGPFPKVEIYRRLGDLNVEPLAGEIDVVAVVTEQRVVLPDRVRLLSLRRPEELADLIEEEFL